MAKKKQEPKKVKVQFTRNCSDELGMHINGDILDVLPEKADWYYSEKWAKPYVVSMAAAANKPKDAETYDPPADPAAPKTTTKKTGDKTTAGGLGGGSVEVDTPPPDENPGATEGG